MNTAPDSLHELVEGFILQLKIENYSPRTISYYSDYVKNFVSYLGNTDISTVTPQHIRLFLSQIGQPKPRSPSNRKDGMAAIIVNPYDIEEVANAIHRAYNMSPEEREARMRKLRQTIRRRDIYWWLDLFFRASSMEI
jgi:site-specific recombinase XerD